MPILRSGLTSHAIGAFLPHTDGRVGSPRAVSLCQRSDPSRVGRRCRPRWGKRTRYQSIDPRPAATAGTNSSCDSVASSSKVASVPLTDSINVRFFQALALPDDLPSLHLVLAAPSVEGGKVRQDFRPQSSLERPHVLPKHDEYRDLQERPKC